MPPPLWRQAASSRSSGRDVSPDDAPPRRAMERQQERESEQKGRSRGSFFFYGAKFIFGAKRKSPRGWQSLRGHIPLGKTAAAACAALIFFLFYQPGRRAECGESACGIPHRLAMYENGQARMPPIMERADRAGIQSGRLPAYAFGKFFSIFCIEVFGVVFTKRDAPPPSHLGRQMRLTSQAG